MYLGDVPLEGTTVLDPFVGGGTSLIEAERCGTRVIGYNIDPVATFITRFELEARALDPMAPEIDAVCESVSSEITPFHRTTVPDVGERMVLYHFWVEIRKCSACRSSFEIHPYYQLAQGGFPNVKYPLLGDYLRSPAMREETHFAKDEKVCFPSFY